MQKRSFIDNSIIEYFYDFDKTFPVNPIGSIHTVKGIKESLHIHNGLELGYCYEGSGMFFVNNKILPFLHGDAAIIFPVEAHIAQSHKNDYSRWHFVIVDVESLLRFLDIEQLIPIIKILSTCSDFNNIINKDNDINIFIYEIIKEMKDKNEDYRSTVTALVWVLMSRLTRLINPAEQPETNISHKSKSFKVISSALSFMAKCYSEEINVKQLASICTLSVPHFRRVFKEAMKLSPLEYLFHIRIKMASLLLSNQPDTIMNISMKVGYTSVTSFNRHFKRITGVTPKEWRREKQPLD